MSDDEFEQSNTEPLNMRPDETREFPKVDATDTAIPLPSVTPAPANPPVPPPLAAPDGSYALGALSGNPYLAPPRQADPYGTSAATGQPYWPAPPPPGTSASGHHPLRNASALAGAALLVLAAGVGIGHAAWTPTATSTSASPSGSAPSANPSAGTGSGTGAGSGATGSSGPNDVSSIASKVDPGLVDIDTSLGYQGEEAAGTGIVLTSSGEILTNNHVIDGATTISVTDVGNNKTYSASVVGYDRTHDVAILQLHNASGLQTASIGNSSNVSVGEDVVGIGNAGGTGGTPSAAGGTVTALNQSITASDEGDGSSEQLTGLIQTNADIQAGDSGGSLVNSSGQVIGMDTAASAGFSLQSPDSTQGNQGFAIPINSALSIAKQIESGNSTSTVHIGATAFLGVEIDPTTSSQGGGGNRFGDGEFGGGIGGGTSVSGAEIAGVVTSSPAQEAGLAQGDVITSVNGTTVTSANGLTNALATDHPGTKVTIGWTDTSGQTQTATVQLTSGPPQ
jgi:S1-C subfamily serine protease